MHVSEANGGNFSSEVAVVEGKKQSTPRSLLNWINASNTKKVQRRMTNRIEYLKHLSVQQGNPTAAGHVLLMNSEIETCKDTMDQRNGGATTKMTASIRPQSSYNHNKRELYGDEDYGSGFPQSSKSGAKIYS